jgi:ATP-binding protein involved in chromosome partitioning
MSKLTKEMVLERLSRVKGPDLEGDIVSLNLVSDVLIDDGKVIFSINVPPERARELQPLREAAEKVLSGLEGVSKVTVVLTAEKPKGAPIRPAPRLDQAAAVPPPMQAQA